VIEVSNPNRLPSSKGIPKLNELSVDDEEEEETQPLSRRERFVSC
jgi:hypothetical protein